MIYPYNCPNCGYQEVVKNADDAARPENCQRCGETLARLWTVPQVTTKDIYTGFNPALGKHIKNKSHLRDELRKHEATTGTPLIEVGSECARVRRPDPEIKLNDGEMRKAHEILQSVEG